MTDSLIHFYINEINLKYFFPNSKPWKQVMYKCIYTRRKCKEIHTVQKNAKKIHILHLHDCTVAMDRKTTLIATCIKGDYSAVIADLVHFAQLNAHLERSVLCLFNFLSVKWNRDTFYLFF